VDPWIIVQGVPLATEPGISLIILPLMEDIATKFETDVSHCVRNVKKKNVLLFKFRCKIFNGVKIIKKTPGSAASRIPCLILAEKPNKMQQCIKLSLFLILNEAQHVSGDTPSIIRSLKLH